MIIYWSNYAGNTQFVLDSRSTLVHKPAALNGNCIDHLEAVLVTLMQGVLLFICTYWSPWCGGSCRLSVLVTLMWSVLSSICIGHLDLGRLVVYMYWSPWSGASCRLYELVTLMRIPLPFICIGHLDVERLVEIFQVIQLQFLRLALVRTGLGVSKVKII